MLNFYTSFLARTAVFKGIPAKDIDKAIACLRGFYKSFECGQEIYRSCDIVSHAGIVVEGSVHAEQIGVDGKTVLLNPNWAQRVRTGGDIRTELDPECAAEYRLPARLLQLSLTGTAPWLPPVKGIPHQGIDI